MTVKCHACARFDLPARIERTPGIPLTPTGMGLCGLDPKWRYQSATKPRECAGFQSKEKDDVRQ